VKEPTPLPAVADLAHVDLLPHCLPPQGSPERSAVLRQLGRQPRLDLEPWLSAIEREDLNPDGELLDSLADRLDGAAAARLLRWWLRCPEADPDLLDRIGRHRDPLVAAQLRTALTPQRAPQLLPLLGHQRDPALFPRLRRWVLEPHPPSTRRAALEGLAVGLAVWPLAELRTLLNTLTSDLDISLAATAVDLLARLPDAGPSLLRPPPAPLLLLVHGRAGGLIPTELLELAGEVEHLRGAPVRLQALTAAEAPQQVELRHRVGAALTLVPLFLLPGTHVCHDVPAIAAAWRASGPVRRLPFLGAWPAWQQALVEEAGGLRCLVHHPVEGDLPRRYLGHLSRITGAACVPSPYSAEDLEELTLAIRTGALPLALAANRLTDSLPALLGPPLLQRPRFRQLLQEQLGALP
jgi:hypothetical protein